MNVKKASIIIPVKNEQDSIEQCIQSIKNILKEELDLEIIVVDNGSNDKTCDIVRSLNNVSLFIHPELNVSGLRNFGAKVANGEILAFVDADCFVDKSWLKNAIPYFSSPRIGIVGSMAEVPPNANSIQKSWNSFRTRNRKDKAVSWINSMNMIVRRDVFFEFEGFNEKLTTCEDVDFCYRVSSKYKIISDPKILVFHAGEADSYKKFFMKELWRGHSNYQGIRSHGLVIREIPSLILPIYYVASFLVGIILIMSGKYFLGFFCIFGFSIMIALYYAAFIEVKYFLHIFVLSMLYFWARFCAIFQKIKR